MTATLAFFWLFAGIAIVSAMLCVTRANAVASALWLVVTLFMLAGIFVLLDAQFVAFLQILIYAGAIMVLFLFVIMLLNLGVRARSDIRGRMGQLIALLGGGLLLVQLVALRAVLPSEEVLLPAGTLESLQREQGAVGMVADPLFRTYLVPFEITSILLLAAIVGAVVMAKRRL